MTANPLPDTLEMLKLSDDKFLVEVSRVISPKPWSHHYQYWIEHPAVIFGVYITLARCRCNQTVVCSRYGETEEGCPSPPIIPGSLADVAETLRVQITQRGMYKQRSVLFDAIWELCPQVPRRGKTDFDAQGWFAIGATPAERIACCLVALGYWQVNKEKEKS